MDILCVVAVQPFVQDVRGDGAGVDLAAQEHFGRDGVGLCVVLAVDLRDVDLVRIEVVLVLDPDVFFLRHPALADVSAAVQDLVVVRAEFVGHELFFAAVVDGRSRILDFAGFIECLVDRQIAAVGEQGEEVGAGLLQVIDQSVVVDRFDAQLREVVDDAVVQFGAVDDVGSEHVGHVGVELDIRDQSGCLDEVVRGDGSVFFAFAGVPLGVISQMERPGEAVVALFPAGGQVGNDIAEVVVLDQSIDEVCQGLLVCRDRSRQIVHAGDLFGIQIIIFRITGVGDAGIRIDTCFSGFAAALRFGTAAAGTAGKQADDHDHGEQQCKILLHNFPP